jgi:hypothetical protein
MLSKSSGSFGLRVSGGDCGGDCFDAQRLNNRKDQCRYADHRRAD